METSETDVSRNVRPTPQTEVALADKQRVRMEIIYSQALREDFDAAFKEHDVGKKFTRLTNVTGAGCSNPHLGDAVWPQLNEMLIIYCGIEEAAAIKLIVEHIRKQYVSEGVACFISTAMEF